MEQQREPPRRRELLAWFVPLLRRLPRVRLGRRGRPKWWWLLASEYHAEPSSQWETCTDVMREQPPLLFAVLIPQRVGS